MAWTAVAAAHPRVAESQAGGVEQGLAARTARFAATTLVPHPADAGILAINGESEPQWNGRPVVVHRQGDKVDWVAEFPDEYWDLFNSYVVSLRWVQLDGPQVWLLEVVDSSHRGNGSLALFTLEDRKLRMVLHTLAVDREREGQHDTSQVFKDGQLRATYEGSTVMLHGLIEMVETESGKLIASFSMSGIWEWNAAERVFKLNPRLTSPHVRLPSMWLPKAGE